MGIEQDQGSRARWRAWYSPIAAVVVAAIVIAAACFEEAMVGYQIWRYGAPGIAQNATEEAASNASLLWPYVRVICADPQTSAEDLGKHADLPQYDGWQGGQYLVLRGGTTEIRQIYLDGSKWDFGWHLQTITVNGELNSVEVNRSWPGPTDGVGQSVLAVYDKDCRLIGATFSESRDSPVHCFGPGWVNSDCEEMENGFEALVDVSGLSFGVTEIRCYYRRTRSEICSTVLETFIPSVWSMWRLNSDPRRAVGR